MPFSKPSITPEEMIEAKRLFAVVGWIISMNSKVHDKPALQKSCLSSEKMLTLVYNESYCLTHNSHVTMFSLVILHTIISNHMFYTHIISN